MRAFVVDRYGSNDAVRTAEMPVPAVMSYRVRSMARRARVRYSFLFMRSSGEQLGAIASLIDSGVIRPVVDRVFPFESTKDALAYVESGRAKGKVVINVMSVRA